MTLVEAMQAQIAALGNASRAADRLAVVFRSYSGTTGNTLPSNPTQEQRREVELWLRMTCHADLIMLGVTREPILRTNVHLTTSEKASRLAQLACSTCGPAIHSFPVDVDPWSAQASKEMKVHIQEGVTKLLTGGYESTQLPVIPQGPVCISVAAVVPMPNGGRGRKDTDNLAKGLLDAMAGVIYTNDKQVQCLTVRRLEYAGTHGHYMVGVEKQKPSPRT